MSLNRCLKIHAKALESFDENQVVEAAAAYISRGMEDDAANVAAVEDHLRELETERDRIKANVLEQWKTADPKGYAKAIKAANDTLPRSTPIQSVSGKVQGATMPDGRIVLVLENLTNDNFAAVLQHEAMHSTLRGLLGDDTYTALMGRLETMVSAGKGAEWATAANAAVPPTTLAENRTEEIAAYAVEQYVKNPETDSPLVQWAKDFLSAIRTAIIQNKALPQAVRDWAIKNVTPQDLAKLAVAGLRRKAEALQQDSETVEPASNEAGELFGQADEEAVAQVAEEPDSNQPVPSYGKAREGAVGVRAMHYSPAERTELKATAYGQGMRGEENKRLQGVENDDIRPRVHFYVDEGNGITPEAGVGGVKHEVTLNNLYDLEQDAEGFNSMNPNNKNAMERAVMTAGFDGYYVRGKEGKQGTVVLVGNQTVPVTRAAEPIAPETYATRLAKSSLPGGRMSGAEWAIAVKNTEFDTPTVRAELAKRSNEILYRDDLARFNEQGEGNIKFSIAQETAATTEPVSPPAPNQLNMLNASARPAWERILNFVKEAIQDKHATLKRLQQIAGISADNIAMNSVGAMDRLGSRLASEQRRLVKAPISKIEDILRKAGFEPDEAMQKFGELLKARHAPDYNRHTATINPAHYDEATGDYLYGFDAAHPGSGIMDWEAAATITNLTGNGDEKARGMLEAETVYRKMIGDLQAFAVDRGLEKQDTINTWNEQFPNYAPFNRELDTDENLSVGTVPGSQGFSLRSGIARRAMGSSADIINPLASTMLWGLKTTTRGENAVVARTVLEFAKDHVVNFMNSGGNLEPMWQVDTIPTQRVVKKVNVYQTLRADGTMSHEFYSREQANDYANVQQAIWTMRNPGANPLNSGIVATKMFDTPQNRVVVQPQPNYLNDDNVVVVPVEGENMIITFNKNSEDGMRIVAALKGQSALGGKGWNKALTIPRMFSSWVRAMSTGFNPVFAVFNAARDVQSAALSIGADKIPGWTAADSASLFKEFMPAAANIHKRLGQEFKALHDKDFTPDPVQRDSYAEWMDVMIEQGGATGIAESVSTVDEAETTLRRTFGADITARRVGANEAQDWLSRGNGGLAKIGDAFYRFGEGETKTPIMSWLSRNVASGAARFNEASELATRTVVFKKAAEKFMADGQPRDVALKMAANISKNASTNFNRRGNLSNALNQLFPFFNAAAQGSARLAETLFEKETYTVDKHGTVMTDQRTKMTPFGRSVLTAMGSLGIMQVALFAMAGMEDDDVPENIKNRAFIVPLGGGSYAAIPMPHGFNLLVNFGREMTSAVLAAASGEPGKALGHVGRGTIGQLGALSPFGSAGNPTTDLAPAIADLPLSLYTNKDAFGRPISREDLNPAMPTPGFTRAKEGASGLARSMAEGINMITGGNEDQKGAFSPTPDQIDFTIGQLTGGVGREAGKLSGVITNTARSAAGYAVEPTPTHKMPLIGRLYGDTQSPTATRAKLFTIRTELNELHARYAGLKERGDTNGAADLLDAHPELAMRGQVERFARGDAALRKKRALARGEGEIGRVNEITNSQDEKVSKLLERYKELRP